LGPDHLPHQPRLLLSDPHREWKLLVRLLPSCCRSFRACRNTLKKRQRLAQLALAILLLALRRRCGKAAGLSQFILASPVGNPGQERCRHLRN
jgi:hypothetical protein